MGAQQQGNFSKAFVPGLVLGLVIGAFAGATLPPILAGKKLPEHKTGVSPSPAERDSRPEEPAPNHEVAPPDEQAGSPGSQPQPGQDPATTPATPPAAPDGNPADGGG